MARPQTLRLGTSTIINTDRDGNGRWWITYYKQCSIFHRDAASVRQTLKFPKGTPSRDALDTWLSELQAIDQSRQASLQSVDLAQSWGPEAHLDEVDSVAGTKMII